MPTKAPRANTKPPFSLSPAHVVLPKRHASISATSWPHPRPAVKAPQPPPKKTWRPDPNSKEKCCEGGLMLMLLPVVFGFCFLDGRCCYFWGVGGGFSREDPLGIWPCKGLATHAIAQLPAAGTNVGWEGLHDARGPHSLNQTVNAWDLSASDLLDLKFSMEPHPKATTKHEKWITWKTGR